ncbi:MAG: thioredoxin domain-containing protein [Bacteroidia bacterium]
MKKGFLVFSLLLLFACKTETSSVLLQAPEFREKIVTEHVQVLDVRTPEEYSEGHLKDAINININSSSFDDETKALYKDLPVYVYCLRGSRSSKASDRLKKLGFQEIYELDNGYDAWLDKGFETYKTTPKKLYANDTIPFAQAIQGNKLVLVDFNATWCGPCKILQPTIDKIHDERTEDVIVYSIDVDQYPDLANKYKATQIPLLLMFKNSEIVHRSLGVIGEQELNELIDKNK